jgi:hypothetical protein
MMRQLNLSIAFSVPSSVQNPKLRHSIFTDQDSAMGNLVEHVFLESKNGLFSNVDTTRLIYKKG